MTSDITEESEKGSRSMQGYNHARFNNSYEYTILVREAAHYYDQMRALRKKFVRDNDYYMGRQLNDTVVYNGHTMTVHDYMQLKGMPALSNDIISDKMVTLKGLVRQQYMAPRVKSVDSQESGYAGLFSEMLRQNDNNNDKSEHSADQFEATLCFGFICDKVTWAFREGREDVRVDAVDPFMLAVPVWERKDLSDVEFIAEAHDLTWPQLLKKFLRHASDEEKLQRIYTAAKQNRVTQGYNDTGMNQNEHLDDFLHSGTVGKYRVIEVWTKEYNRAYWYHDRLNGTCGFRPISDKAAMDAENEQRRRDNIVVDENGMTVMDENGMVRKYVPDAELELIEYEMQIEEMWYYRWLSPNGYLLDEGRSPYKVLRDGYSWYYHPYVFLAYGFNREVRSFEDRLIDKQRQYNHDNIMLDFIIMNASKGVLAIDKESLVEEQSVDDIAENYVKVDGIILYTSKRGGNLPTTLQNKSLPAGIELIMQRDAGLVKQQSGIQEALQGVHQGNTSGKQYQIEKESAATSVTDYVSTFNNFMLRVAKKQMWTMQWYYTSHHSVLLTGEDMRQYFNPETMKDIDFDLALTLDSNSTVIREQMKDLAYQAYQKDEIEFGQMLDVADFGDTAKLKRAWEDYKQRKQQMQMAQAQAGVAVQGDDAQKQNGAAHLTPADDDGGHTLVGTTGTSS